MQLKRHVSELQNRPSSSRQVSLGLTLHKMILIAEGFLSMSVLLGWHFRRKRADAPVWVEALSGKKQL